MSMNLEFFKTLVSGLNTQINKLKTEKIDPQRVEGMYYSSVEPIYSGVGGSWTEQPVEFVAGKEYTIRIGDKTYTEAARVEQVDQWGSHAMCIGSRYTKEPYWIWTWCSSGDLSVTERLKIEGKDITNETKVEIITEENHPIDEKYFPSTVFTQNSAPVKYGTGGSSAVQGKNTSATGGYSHAEGSETTAQGNYSHAEGRDTIVAGEYSHVEGYQTTVNAYNQYCHAEGVGTYANGHGSHAEGYQTKTDAYYSHAEGYGTSATRAHQSVSGSFNIEDGKYGIFVLVSSATIKSNIVVYNDCKHDSYNNVFNMVGAGVSTPHNQLEGKYAKTNDSKIVYYKKLNSTTSTSSSYTTEIRDSRRSNSTKGTYAHIVGNGTSDTARSNAHTLAWDGTAWFAGDIYVGSTSGTDKDEGSKRLVTETDLEESTTNCLKATGGTYDLSNVLVLKNPSNTHYLDTILAMESNPLTVGGNEFIYRTRCVEGGFHLSRETEAIPDYQSTIINPNIWQMLDNHTGDDHMRLYVRPSSIQFQRYDNGYKTFYLQAEKDRTKIYNDQKLIDFAESRLSNVATPTEDNDAANKAYVDAHIIASSTPGSTKKFRITVDDSGTISATEVAES